MPPDIDLDVDEIRRHAAGLGSAATPQRGAPDGFGPIADPPVCLVHTDTISYVRCRECSRPACAVCREDSAAGLLCAACADNARNSDGVRVAPRLAIASLVCTLVLTAVGAASVLSPMLLREIAFAPFTVSSSPWRLLTGVLAVPRWGVPALVGSVLAFWLVARVYEHRRGSTALGVTAGVGAIGGFVLPYVTASPTSAAWTAALGTSIAATAALTVAALWPGATARTGAAGWVAAAAGVVAIVGAVATGVAAPWQVVGGLLVGVLLELVRAVSPRPQRHPLPLFVGFGIVALLLILAVVVRLLL